MKKFVPALSIVLFPYAVAFVLYGIFSGFLMENIFQDNIYFCLFILLIIWLVALICAVSTCAVSLMRKWDFVELCRVNMLIKTISIPAYLFTFIFGTVCMLTIFTFAISVILMVLDAMAIVLSGLIGISAVIRSCDNKAISARETFFYGILQFVFCADVITSIIVFRKSKKKVKVNV
ncbi:hypothetical protein [Blautia hydrogenotrophica]|uniref:hypothetical protein n=1 Tax=Blautia hydrogenotrophica TaxID=53443 RepID=UPI003A891CB8